MQDIRIFKSNEKEFIITKNFVRMMIIVCALLILSILTVCGLDEEILSATRWHTLGKIEMSDFEKIIFLADKIEKRTRPLEYRIEIEKALEKSLDNALLVCYGNTIKSLVDRNLKICSQTIEIYNNLLNILDSKE